MFGGILSKSEPDEDWSIWDEYKAEMLGVRGLKREAFIENVIEFDAVAKEQGLDERVSDYIRGQILEVQQLGLPVRIRLVPVR